MTLLGLGQAKKSLFPILPIKNNNVRKHKKNGHEVFVDQYHPLVNILFSNDENVPFYNIFL